MQNPNIKYMNKPSFRFYVDISNRNPKELRDLALHLAKLGAISSSHSHTLRKLTSDDPEKLAIKLGNQLVRGVEKDKKLTKSKFKNRFYHILKVRYLPIYDAWEAQVTDMREYSEDGNVYCLDYNVIMRTKKLVPEDKFWTLT